MQPSHDISAQQHADVYALSINDQPQSQLRIVVFEWDWVSGYLRPRDGSEGVAKVACNLLKNVKFVLLSYVLNILYIILPRFYDMT